MKSIKDLLTQAGQTLQAVLEYFRLKNKRLWTGAANAGDNITVPDVEKYRTLRVYPYETLNGITCERVGHTFIGEGMIEGVSSETVHSSYQLAATFTEPNTIGIVRAQLMHHIGDGAHRVSNQPVRIIIGAEPVIPEALKNILGGGYRIARYLKGGVRREIVGYFAGTSCRHQTPKAGCLYCNRECRRNIPTKLFGMRNTATTRNIFSYRLLRSDNFCSDINNNGEYKQRRKSNRPSKQKHNVQRWRYQCLGNSSASHFGKGRTAKLRKLQYRMEMRWSYGSHKAERVAVRGCI